MILTNAETKFLMMLLTAELRVKSERLLYAGSRDSTFYDPQFVVCESLLEKVESEKASMDSFCKTHSLDGGTHDKK